MAERVDQEAPALLDEEGGDDLCKAESPRKLPHRYPQSLIDAGTPVYEQAMRRMLDQIEDALTSS